MVLKQVKRPAGRPKQGDSRVISDDVLLEAVLVSFGENGFAGTSVREIARHLGVSHNLIPQRFGSKNNLWFAAVDYGFGFIYRDLEQEAKKLGDDELVVLRGVMVRAIELTAQRPALLQIVNQEATKEGPRLKYLYDSFIKPGRDFGDAWLNKLSGEGKIRNTSVTLLYFLMSHGSGGFFAMSALTSKLKSDEHELSILDTRSQAEQLTNIIFDGILSD